MKLMMQHKTGFLCKVQFYQGYCLWLSILHSSMTVYVDLKQVQSCPMQYIQCNVVTQNGYF
jgi:hypothetical protein